MHGKAFLLSFALLLSCAPGAPARPLAPQTGDTCDCEAQRPETLAVVNGVKIATSQIDDDASDLVAPIRAQMDRLREQGLQTLITNRLLELEAAKRGVSTSKLIQTDVVAKADPPTDDELRAFYDRNRSQLQGEFDDVKENLRQYIVSQRQQVEMTLLTTGLRNAATVEVLEYSPKAPATPADRAKVLATVNGTKITSADLEESLKSFLYGYRRQIYQVEADALRDRVDDVLIDQEAAKRGVTTQALVDAEIKPNVKKVDAFDASKFYNDNKAQFGGRAFADVKDDLMEFMRAREILNAKRAFGDRLRKTATVQVSLVEPAPPTYVIDTTGRPTKGDSHAAVTVVVFSDFQCPKCAVMHTQVDEVLKAYAGKVRVVMRNYPLEQHTWSHKAAEAAEAAYEQGKFWEYSDLLFANQKVLSEEKLKELATQVGLDRAKFDAALASGKFADVVDRDLTDGTKAGVLGTPAVYVNGVLVVDDSPTGLKAAIDEALKH